MHTYPSHSWQTAVAHLHAVELRDVGDRHKDRISGVLELHLNANLRVPNNQAGIWVLCLQL